MRAYIELMRVNVCLLAWFAFFVGALVIRFDFLASLMEFLLASITVVAICAGGNVINDYFDREIDRINKRQRPIPSGRASIKAVFFLYAFLNIMGLGAAYFVGVYFFVLAFINFVVAFVYSFRLKKTFFVGNAVDSYLASVCFVAPALIKGSFIQLLYSPLLLLGLIAFLVNFGREVIKDIEDVEGDRALGAKTTAIVLGPERAWTIATVFIGLGVLLGLLPYFHGLVSIMYFIGFVPATVLCIVAILKKHTPTKAQMLIKFAMFLVLFGFLAGALL